VCYGLNRLGVRCQFTKPTEAVNFAQGEFYDACAFVGCHRLHKSGIYGAELLAGRAAVILVMGCFGEVPL